MKSKLPRNVPAGSSCEPGVLEKISQLDRKARVREKGQRLAIFLRGSGSDLKIIKQPQIAKIKSKKLKQERQDDW
jgi:hypothetical protein